MTNILFNKDLGKILLISYLGFIIIVILTLGTIF